MITVKDSSGQEKNVASRGVGNTALGLSIGALGYMLANGGLLNTGANTPCCDPVNCREFYEYQLAEKDRFFNYAIDNEKRLGELESRIATDETAIAWQQRLTNKEFKCTDDKINTTYLLSKLYTDAQTCDCVKGEKLLPVNEIGMPLRAQDNYIRTYPGYNSFCGYNYGCCDNGYNNWF